MSTETFRAGLFLTAFRVFGYSDPEVPPGSAQVPRAVHVPNTPTKKRKQKVRIVNAEPSRSITSLLAAEKLVGKGRARFLDEAKTKIELIDGAAEVPYRDQADMGERLMIRRTHNTANLRSILAEFTAHRNERLVEMTTVLPIYFGESEPDGIARQVRNRGPKRTPASDK